VGLADGSARGIAEELAKLAVVAQPMVSRSVTRGESPDAVRIAAPAHRVGDAISAVGVSRATAVLEVIEARPSHHRIPDRAEVDEQVTVLVTKQRRERDAPGWALSPPKFRVVGGPPAP